VTVSSSLTLARNRGQPIAQNNKSRVSAAKESGRQIHFDFECKNVVLIGKLSQTCAAKLLFEREFDAKEVLDLHL
jgi:hypothetical protein